MRVLDLFAGIGGFTLGLERAGFETVAFCEIEPYAQKVLAKHWPGVPIYDDVRELTAERLIRDGIGVDVITGGFPCQDISTAGQQAGIDGERSGLWSEIARLIGELRPRYAIMENVTNLLAGERGAWFGRVLGDLAQIGYDAEWHCIPASHVGAHHRRDRVWIVAYPSQQRCDNGGCDRERGHLQGDQDRPDKKSKQEWDKWESGVGEICEVVADTKSGADRNECENKWAPSREINSSRNASSSSRGDDKPQDGSFMAHPKRIRLQGQGVHGGRVNKKANPNRQADWIVHGGQGNAPIWDAEPGLGFCVDGFSRRLDEIGGLSEEAKRSAKKALPTMRNTVWQEAYEWAAGGFRGVSEAQILLSILCEYERYKDCGRVAMDSKEDASAIMRGVWVNIETASPSLQSRCGRQFAREYSDALHKLSRHTPSQFQAAWRTSVWEDGVPRVVDGVPNRSHRLKCLGNAVVPQIPELIGRAILEAENAG